MQSEMIPTILVTVSFSQITWVGIRSTVTDSDGQTDKQTEVIRSLLTALFSDRPKLRMDVLRSAEFNLMLRPTFGCWLANICLSYIL